MPFLRRKFMAKQRYINTKFWSDNYVSDLNPLDRYLFLYFLTNEHTNICGIYEVPLKTIAFETGIELDMLKKMLKRLMGKIYYIDGWVYIKNFARHQAVNDSIIKGIDVAKSTIPKEILNKINKIEQAGDRVGTASPQDPTYLNSNLNLNSNIDINIDSNNNATHSVADIILLLDMFSLMNPAVKRMYGNTTQRKACRELIDTYGLDRIKKIILDTLPKTNGLQYFPTITTPLQLQDKFIALESAIRKYQSEKITNKEKYKVI
jgi:hypothetical protein